LCKRGIGRWEWLFHLGADQWFVGSQVRESAAPFGQPLFLNIYSVDAHRRAKNLLEDTLSRLRNGYMDQDFDVLKPFLTGGESPGDGIAAAQRLGLSASAFKVAVHRLRKRYRQVLRSEIAKTVADAAQVDEEIR
jgi:hypothetical protein